MTLTKRYKKMRTELTKIITEMQDASKITDDIEMKVSIKSATKRLNYLRTEFMKNYFAIEDADRILERNR